MAIAASERSPIHAVDWGVEYQTPVIDVYFARAGQVFDDVTSDGWTIYQITQAMNALETISNVTNLNFRRTLNVDRAEFKLVATDYLPFAGAYMFPDDVYGERGVGVFNTSALRWQDDSNMEAGSFAFEIFLHEFGHGLGMAHPHDNGGTSERMDGVYASYSKGIYELNSNINTVMSYNRTLGTETVNVTTPMALDIAVLQDKYGVNTSYNTGNNVYRLKDTDVQTYRTEATAIWDAGGTDTIRYGGTLDAVIDLRPATLLYEEGGGGFISSVSGRQNTIFTIANGVVIERGIGGDGNDEITGNSADNLLSGNAGRDILTGGDGDDLLQGGDDNDRLYGGADNDVLHGDAGNDRLFGQEGNDRLYGKEGDDSLSGGQGDDRLQGGAGGDVLNGNGGFDRIDFFDAQAAVTLDLRNGNANAGDAAGDVLISIEGIIGSRYDDDLRGDIGDDALAGARGADRLIGRQGADTLRGGENDDTLQGGADNDLLDGGSGEDMLSGGAGADVFLFRNLDGDDTITDFRSGQDQLNLRKAGVEFEALTITDDGTDTLVNYGTGTITLLDLRASDLDAGDFIL